MGDLVGDGCELQKTQVLSTRPSAIWPIGSKRCRPLHWVSVIASPTRARHQRVMACGTLAYPRGRNTGGPPIPRRPVTDLKPLVLLDIASSDGSFRTIIAEERTDLY